MRRGNDISVLLAVAAMLAGGPASAAPKPVAALKPADDNAGFLTRLGRKIRALVSGS